MSPNENANAIKHGLSAKQQAALEKLFKGKAQLPGVLGVKQIPKRQAYSPVPVSFAQQRLWILDRMVPGSAFYNIPNAIEFKGKLDIEIFERSLNEMVRRHESLRTVFSTDPETEEPVQVILPELSLKIDIFDLQGLSAAEQEAEKARIMQADAGKPFDLARGPLLRVNLLRLTASTCILQYTMHHIISDTWSMEIFTREFSEISAALSRGEASPLAAPPLQYADFAVWQRQWLQGDVLEKQLAYWRKVLGGELPILELPTDRQRPAVSTYQGQLKYIYFPGNITVPLNELNRKERCSMFMTLLAAFSLLLYRYSGQEDILVGSPIANRTRVEVENMIGFFANTLVFRTDLSGNPTFRELLARLRKVTAGAYGNQDVPFEKLVEELQPDRYMSHTPFFQAMFAMQNVPTQETDAAAVEEAEARTLPVYSGSAKFDLWLSLSHSGEILSGSIDYSTDIFVEGTIDRFLQHLETLLAGIGANPDQRIGDLPILTAKEQAQILEEWNHTQTPYHLRCLHHLVEEQAVKTPDQSALIFEDSLLSYDELNKKSAQTAHVLQQRGVKPESIVGVCLERSLAMVTSLLGILKAGGAYLPMDPELPRERIDYMLTDSGANVSITGGTAGEEDETAGSWQGEKIFPEEIFDVPTSDAYPLTPLPSYLQRSSSLAYIIYTSGSTGRPKGVMVPHKGVCNRLLWMQAAYGLTGADRVLQKTPFGFDVSVWEFFWPLLTGAGLVLARPGGHKDSAYLVEVITRMRVTTIHFVPTMLNVFLEEAGIQGMRSLKRVISSGEALPSEYRDRFFERLGAELHNLYGPTEASVDVTAWACRPHEHRHPVPIGKPIANTQIYILDRRLNLVPVGVHGELHIGGIQLARGYLNRPELTAEKFCLWQPGGALFEKTAPPGRRRLYKTGDLARWQPDGNIEFIGRLDFQVKVRGFRIELGEIESTLRSYPGIEEGVVLAREEPDRQGQKLVGYVVPGSDYWDSCQEKAGPGSWENQVDDWQGVFDETYGQDSSQTDPFFNINGWNSSYTGEPLPPEEMREWLDRTVQRILSLKPEKIMEIGCGTGLFLFQLIPFCQYYLGTDIAKRGLDYIQQQLTRSQTDIPNASAWARVELLQRSAENFDGIPDEELDLVILNSVVQYFPSAEYLVKVLQEAAKKVKPGGHIFIGDLRSLPLLKMFHASVEFQRAEPGTTREQLHSLVINRVAREQELVIDPDLFLALKQREPKIKEVEGLWKEGSYSNELSKFRIDVVLTIDNKEHPGTQPHLVLDWNREKPGIPQLQRQLAAVAGEPGTVLITNVLNSRLDRDTRVLKWLTGKTGPAAVEAYRQDEALTLESGIDPGSFRELCEETPYRVQAVHTGLGTAVPGTYDVLLVHRHLRSEPLLCRSNPVKNLEIHPWGWYANNPLLVKTTASLAPELRFYLRERLPEYMVPPHIVVLDRLPMTSNGKLDRRALPEPVQILQESGGEFKEPTTEMEVFFTDIWANVLNLDKSKISTDHNFFQLGGDSINAIQVVSRANKEGYQLSVQVLYQNQAIAELAQAVERRKKKGIPEETRSDGLVEEFLAGIDREEVLRQLGAGLEIEDLYPATPLQEHQIAYLENQRIDDPPLYLFQRSSKPLSMALDVSLLNRALQVTASMNRNLRTFLLWKNLSRPIQVVCKQVEFEFQYLDFSQWSADEAHQRQMFREVLENDWEKTFQRNQSTPMRVGIVKLAENRFQYYFTGDYTRLDGWSGNNILMETFDNYAALASGNPPGEKPANCYKEYLFTLVRQEEAVARDFWQSVFKEFTAPPLLTAAPGNVTGQGSGYARDHLYLSAEASINLERLLQEQRWSLSTLIQGVWAMLISRYIQQEKVVYGMVTTGRSMGMAGIEYMNGHSINILPVYLAITPAETFKSYMKRIWDLQAEWTLYEYTKLDDIYDWCGISQYPLFESFIVIQNLTSAKGEIRGMVRDVQSWQKDSHLMYAKMEYPLRFDIFSGVEYCLILEYYRRYFSDPVMKGVLANLQVVIEAVIRDPGQTVERLLRLINPEIYRSYTDSGPNEFFA